MRRLTQSLTLRGRCFLAAGVALLVCGMVLGFRDITRLGVLVGGLPLLASTLTSRQRLRLTASRTVSPSRVHIDETCDVVLTMGNAGSLRTPIVMAEEHLDHALGDRPRFVVPRMGAGARHELRYRVRSNVRGRHRLGPLALRIKDPFELTARVASVPGASEVIVLPRVLSLNDGDASGGVGHEGTIPHMIALHGEDDVSVREYRDGDDLRRIHWPATARTGDLMVRQEDRPARRRVVILLDDRNVTDAGPRTAGSFEWAITAAASLVSHFLDQGLTTHLISAGERISSTNPDESALDDALESLAIAEMRAPEVFVATLEQAADVASLGALVVAVVAPMADPPLALLARLRSTGSAAIAMVLDVGRPRFEGGATATATEEALRDRGWSTVTVASGMSVPEAWRIATRSLTGVRR